jgi:hypothetical protein
MGANDDSAAKGRNTPAAFVDSDGGVFLFFAGNSKGSDGMTSVPPSLARLRVNLPDGGPAYLAIDATLGSPLMLSPGSPLVTSAAGAAGIVWVVDVNANRKQSLIAPGAPRPLLWAFDAATLATLFQSGPTDLDVGGKYTTPVVAHGTVFVGTDRISAFGLQQ